MKLDLTRRKEIAVKAAEQAGRILVDNFGRTIKIKDKGDWSLVSEVDIAAEEKIIGLIKKACPQDSILSEEGRGKIAIGSDFKWIIDPLDGTHNYIKGITVFGVSIALEFKNEVVLGVIYMPLANELYTAEKGKGAYLNNKKISVSERDLSRATLSYDSSIRYNKKPMIDCLERVSDKVFNIRMFGSSVRSLSYVAEGKIDLAIEFNDKPWDFAAGLILVEEAGGRATDLRGNKWSIASAGYVASNGIVHEDILTIINA